MICAEMTFASNWKTIFWDGVKFKVPVSFVKEITNEEGLDVLTCSNDDIYMSMVYVDGSGMNLYDIKIDY